MPAEIIIYSLAALGVLAVIAATACAISILDYHVREWLKRRRRLGIGGKIG